MDNKDEIEIHNTDTFVDEDYKVEYFNNDGESIGKVIPDTTIIGYAQREDENGFDVCTATFTMPTCAGSIMAHGLPTTT